MKRLPRALLTLLAVLTLCACGDKAQDGSNGENAAVAWDTLSFDKTMPLDYATQFSVSFAGDDYKRITIGRCVVDGWRDTVEDGIAIVKEAVMGLIKDDETKAMINQIMRLIARDQNGNLKASKVLQLDTLAEELHNERLNEGIAIIKESYIPNLSKTYIRAEWKDDNGVWRYVPLGMTEA